MSIAVVASPPAPGEALRPDPAQAPAAAAPLHPDSFPGATTVTPAERVPAAAITPTGEAKGLPALGESLQSPPPAAVHPTPHAAQPPRPVMPAPIEPPNTADSPTALARTITVKPPTPVRLHLPRSVRGSFTLSELVRLPAIVTGSFRAPAVLRPQTAPALGVAKPRDLHPAALALLALLATSGCLLGVAAWWGREEREW